MEEVTTAHCTGLGLDIDKEHDLISIAQYHLNEKQNRSGLNRALIEQLSPGHAPTDNHRILARLPIKTYWTTNYDKLIEDSLKAAGKIPDVKFTLDHLKLTSRSGMPSCIRCTVTSTTLTTRSLLRMTMSVMNRRAASM